MGSENGAAERRGVGSPGGARAGQSSRRARARQKAAHTITLDDVRRYRHMGVVAESMKPPARMAQEELRAWVADLGGDERVTAQHFQGRSEVGHLTQRERLVLRERMGPLQVGGEQSFDRGEIGLRRAVHEIDNQHSCIV